MKTNFQDFYIRSIVNGTGNSSRYINLQKQRQTLAEEGDMQALKQTEKELCRYLSNEFFVLAYTTKDPVKSQKYERKSNELRNHPETFFIGAN